MPRLTIHKYSLAVEDVQTIWMHKPTQMLDVQMQDGLPCLWAMVDPDMPMVTREIRCLGTGHRVEAVGEYIGTVQLPNARLVFHYFDAGTIASARTPATV